MRVVGLGAICDLGAHALDDQRENNFDVCEFAVLDDGARVILHAERGYGGRSSSGSIWALETVETITRSVLTTVLPDDATADTEDEHPYEWLAGLAHDQGIDVTADQLRQVPYQVELTERVLEQLFASASHEKDDDFKRNLPRWASIELPVFRVADWDGTWSLGDSVRAASIATDGAHRFFGTLSQDVSHRRPEARGEVVTITSSRPDPYLRTVQLDNMSIQLEKSQPRDNNTAVDTSELRYEWEQRLHSGEFPWTPTTFSVDGAPSEFQLLVVDDVWFASTRLDEDVDIELLGVHTPFADLELTRVTDPPPTTDA